MTASKSVVEPVHRWERRESLALIALCLVVVLVYASLVRAPFLAWDDDLNIYGNPYYTGGSWWALWSKPYFGMYIPIVSTIWAGLFHVGGGNAWPFRVLNLTLHVINVILFTALLRGLLRRFQVQSNAAVLIGATIFALHPEQTAAVSWISGGRDLASTGFAFAAVGLYFGRHGHKHILASILFACGLLCKPGIAGVPLAIVAFVWIFERERLVETLATMGVWSLMVLASIVMTSRAQARMLTVVVPLAHRPLVAFDALGFYLLKSAWPFPLAADYGRTPAAVWQRPWQMAPTIGILVACAAGLWWASRKNRHYAIGFVWPLLLAPVLGVITFPYQRISTVADHYNYLPLAVVGAIVAVGVAQSRWRSSRWTWALVALLVVAGGASTWVRSRVWHDNDRFFTDTLVKNPASIFARTNYSSLLCERGDWQAGLSIVGPAATQQPVDPGILANDAFCLFRAGRLDEVFALQARLLDPMLREDLDRNPGPAETLANSFAGAFIMADKPLKAFAYLCQAQAIAPGDADVTKNMEVLVATLRKRGRTVRCAGKLRWDQLEQIVQILN